MRIYFMPVTGDGTKGNPRQPKYAATDMAEYNWSMMDYGVEPFCMVVTDDIPSLEAKADVLSIPANIDQHLTAEEVTRVQKSLEAENVPADWVTTTLTYRQVIRKVAGIFSLLQRLHFHNSARLFSSTKLALHFGSLSEETKGHILLAASDLGVVLKADATIREMLNSFGNRLQNRQLNMNCMVI